MSYARNAARLARTGIITVDTAQDLRDLTIYGGLRPEAVQTLGANAKGDGGGGQWYWDGTDTTADNLGTVIKEAANATGRWKRLYSASVNVKWFGAVGDGTTDDTNTVNGANSALTSNSSLFFPCGIYRYTGTAKLGALLLDGISNISIIFEKGAKLLLDNLDGTGQGTTSGVFVKGPSSNVLLDGVNIEWATVPSARSQGDGFTIKGEPGGTNLVNNIVLRNTSTKNSPQTGCIFMGVSNISVQNHKSIDTLADGLHFNACQKVSVDGYTASGTGDDSLAFVTYYHATDPGGATDRASYNRPGLDEWSNCWCTVKNLNIKETTHGNGIRVAGSQYINITGATIYNLATGSAMLVDSGPSGGTRGWDNVASKNIIFSSINSSHHISVVQENVTNAGNARYLDFDVVFENINIDTSAPRKPTHSIYTVANKGTSATDNGVIKRISFKNIDIKGNIPCLFSNLENSVFSDITSDGKIEISGVRRIAANFADYPISNNMLSNVTAKDIYIHDIAGCVINGLTSLEPRTTAITIVNAVDMVMNDVQVIRPNRDASAGITRGLQLTAISSLRITGYQFITDGISVTSGRAIELGGALNGSSSEFISITEVFVSTKLNSTSNQILVAGGASAPISVLITGTTQNTGATPPNRIAINVNT